MPRKFPALLLQCARIRRAYAKLLTHMDLISSITNNHDRHDDTDLPPPIIAHWLWYVKVCVPYAYDMFCYVYIHILQHLCCQIELGAWGERIIITIIRMIIIRPPSPRGDGRGRVVKYDSAYKNRPPITE